MLFIGDLQKITGQMQYLELPNCNQMLLFFYCYYGKSTAVDARQLIMVFPLTYISLLLKQSKCSISMIYTIWKSDKRFYLKRPNIIHYIKEGKHWKLHFNDLGSDLCKKTSIML